ncbi:MAG: ATP-binding protein, partial [Cyanobacteria bacterium P01_F01_bin.153]
LVMPVETPEDLDVNSTALRNRGPACGGKGGRRRGPLGVHGAVRPREKSYPNPTIELLEVIEDADLNFIKSDSSQLVESMQTGLERINGIIKSLRIFSRLDETAVKHVNVHEGIDSTLVILGAKCKAVSKYPAIKIVRDYDNLPEIECYAGQLNQVFMNIIGNAIDALRVTERNAAPRIEIRTQTISDDWVGIEITDNAGGIPESVHTRLFDPFFTTKPVGKGTGLGLSISHKIINETHKGDLSFQSELGKGTTFRIKVPVEVSAWKETSTSSEQESAPESLNV